jgi:hypothetical protein
MKVESDLLGYHVAGILRANGEPDKAWAAVNHFFSRMSLQLDRPRTEDSLFAKELFGLVFSQSRFLIAFVAATSF